MTIICILVNKVVIWHNLEQKDSIEKKNPPTTAESKTFDFELVIVFNQSNILVIKIYHRLLLFNNKEKW